MPKARSGGRGSGERLPWVLPLASRAVVVEDDVLLPSQMERAANDSPERRLYRAVLEEAIHNLRRYHPDHEVHRDARAWIVSTERTWPMHFEVVCEYLGLDADVARKAILRRMNVITLSPRCVTTTGGSGITRVRSIDRRNARGPHGFGRRNK